MQYMQLKQIFWLQWIGDLQKSVKQYTIFWE